ncbi:MAG: hypothetical protein K2W82_16565 [Candidatus Obscuribacterales bacterium]|nr:hypothetical protein [Candidatus Obscuribacterales bacterium]
MNPNLLPILLWVVPSIVGLLLLLIFGRKFFVNVGSTSIAILERRYWGRKLPAGRVLAANKEIGLQAGYLSPGFYPLFWPFTVVSKKVANLEIGADNLGVVTALDGEPLPADRIFARDTAGDNHNGFQDPVGFLSHQGMRGTQLRLLTPGTHKIHPCLFTVELIAKTVIPEGKIGVITAADGAALEAGQLIGKRVAGHDNFQKADAFLQAGGQKGPQVDFLRPGTYNINTKIFRVEVRDAVKVTDENVGIVEALAGEPMVRGDVVAETPELGTHNSYQDGQAFLDGNGKRGPQELVLRPGTFYINPYLFTVKLMPMTVIKEGTVGVMISNIGRDPSQLDADQNETPPSEGSATDPEDARLSKGVRQRHVVPNGYRGIQQEVLGPGSYPINPLAHKVIPIPTTTRSVEWSETEGQGSGQGQQQRQAASTFDPFSVVSSDGFNMKVEVRCQYRILPENAPYVLQKLGSIAELERNVIHPQIDGIFRAQVSKSPAINYQQKRAEEQEQAQEAVRQDLRQYKVEVVSVMICNIVLPEELMHTTQEKNLAQQKESMFDAQEKAEQRRIEFESTRARADQQGKLMAAKVGIDVAEHEAKQAEKRAQGAASAVTLAATAEADRIEKTGKAEAAVITARGEAQAKAYEGQVAALTAQGVTAVELFKLIATGKIKITPDVVVSGQGGSENGLVQLLLANAVQTSLKPQTATQAAPEASVLPVAEGETTTAAEPALETPAVPAKA